MPVRSLNSSVLKWPDAAKVDRAVRNWGARLAQDRTDVLRLGYFGSYARGDWGVGSDLDVIIIVERTAQSFERRGVEWDATDLPVPADVLVYTQEEWESLDRQGRMSRALRDEVVWIYVRP